MILWKDFDFLIFDEVEQSLASEILSKIVLRFQVKLMNSKHHAISVVANSNESTDVFGGKEQNIVH